MHKLYKRHPITNSLDLALRPRPSNLRTSYPDRDELCSVKPSQRPGDRIVLGFLQGSPGLWVFRASCVGRVKDRGTHRPPFAVQPLSGRRHIRLLHDTCGSLCGFMISFYMRLFARTLEYFI